MPQTHADLDKFRIPYNSVLSGKPEVAYIMQRAASDRSLHAYSQIAVLKDDKVGRIARTLAIALF